MKNGVAVIQFGARYTVPNVARLVFEPGVSGASVVGMRSRAEEAYDLYVPVWSQDTVIINQIGPYYEAVVTPR